jgi:hypothetical protein
MLARLLNTGMIYFRSKVNLTDLFLKNKKQKPSHLYVTESVCSLQLTRNLLILTRSCKRTCKGQGGMFSVLQLISGKGTRVAIAISSAAPRALLRWAGRSGCQVKGWLPSFLQGSNDREAHSGAGRPVPFTSPSRSSGWTDEGERGRRHCRARLALAGQTSELFLLPPMILIPSQFRV